MRLVATSRFLFDTQSCKGLVTVGGAVVHENDVKFCTEFIQQYLESVPVKDEAVPITVSSQSQGST